VGKGGTCLDEEEVDLFDEDCDFCEEVEGF
jgi:hypothetical protein